MLTQTQFVTEIFESMNEDSAVTKSGIKEVLEALEYVVLTEISAGEKVKIAQLVQLQPKVKAKTKARMGRNPQTGEAVKISAKPASVVVRARVLTRAKEAAPSVKKLQAKS